MKFSVLTLLPEVYKSLYSSVTGRALGKEIFDLSVINIRDFSDDKHKKCDDTPFGGGPGMVMTPQPIHSAIECIDPEHRALRLYMSPKGERLNQKIVKELSAHEWILIFNGSFEGVDQRVLDLDFDREISIGDYVLTSGDYASIVLINAISRYIPGVLGSDSSLLEESFSEGFLEYPHYTRPQNFLGLDVPEVLLSGNHKKIAEWRKEQSRKTTVKMRPDLLEK